jgi:hypothetical protein
VAETTVKTSILRVSTHWQSEGTSISTLVEALSRNKCFSRLEYHIFYVLNLFVAYLLSLTRISQDNQPSGSHMNPRPF